MFAKILIPCLPVIGLAACAVDEPPPAATDVAAVSAASSAFGGDGYGGDDGGGGGGGEAVPPFQPPPLPFPIARNLTLDPTGVVVGSQHHCEQDQFVGVAFSHDVLQGTTLFGFGVTSPGTKAVIGIYTPAGGLIKVHTTNASGSNCVIAHEPETISTSDLMPGYYFVYASFYRLTPNGIDTTINYRDGIPTAAGGHFVTALRIR